MQLKRIGVACASMAVMAFAACSDDDGNDEPGLEDPVDKRR